MLKSSKIRRRMYVFGEDDIVEASPMAESHYREWLGDGLKATGETRELIGRAATTVRKHIYLSPSGVKRGVWVAEESHRAGCER